MQLHIVSRWGVGVGCETAVPGKIPWMIVRANVFNLLRKCYIATYLWVFVSERETFCRHISTDCSAVEYLKYGGEHCKECVYSAVHCDLWESNSGRNYHTTSWIWKNSIQFIIFTCRSPRFCVENHRSCFNILNFNLSSEFNMMLTK